ncbi:substrate-binding periplasmic protein [Salidesulfovibrio onnuriiensis]|uniref:substrate-binding periplasmic protein n=1 Tax=Salidesulfovibrio onnuriiensis TaxID=2583823 RepID=UPI001650AFE9|nr:transporter substrate-binding domain-containing protein [Salidesulfovibrio onnuriiensis]
MSHPASAKRLCAAAILFAILVIMAPAHTAAQERQPTLMLAVGEWAPYVSENSEGYGFAAEIVIKAFRAAGQDVELVFMPWARSLELVKRGELPATFPWYMNTDRELFAWFSEPIFRECSVFFYKKDRFPDFRFQSLETMRQYRVGGVDDYGYLPLLKEKGVLDSVSHVDPQGMRMLEDDRIDFLAQNIVRGWYTIEELFPDKKTEFATSDPFMKDDAMGLLASRRHPQGKLALALFNKGLIIIKKNGTYRAILEKHHMCRLLGN